MQPSAYVMADSDNVVTQLNAKKNDVIMKLVQFAIAFVQ